MGLLTSIKPSEFEGSWIQHLWEAVHGGKKLWSDNQHQKCKYEKGASARDAKSFPVPSTHNSKICKVNNVEIILFVVLIDKNCSATFVTSLCRWLKSVGSATQVRLSFHSFSLFCTLPLLCAGTVFFKPHCWYMWHFLIFSTIMTSDTLLGNAETSSGPAMAKELKGYLDLVEAPGILHRWSCPETLVCAAEFHSSVGDGPVRTHQVVWEPLIIPPPHPHLPFHPSFLALPSSSFPLQKCPMDLVTSPATQGTGSLCCRKTTKHSLQHLLPVSHCLSSVIKVFQRV